MRSPAVRIERLNKYYEEGGQRHQILNELDAQFQGGAFTVVLGKSGCGKSTLLNLISGVDVADGGCIHIGDTCVTAMSERDRTVFRRDRVGMVFQFFNLIQTLTVLENVTLPQELAGRADPAPALELLRRVGLADRAHTMPDRLSGGEQQRVAIARALCHDPALVLADEPTGNLDTDTGKEIVSLLLELVRERGKTLVMATHSLEVLPLADAVYTFAGGKLASAE